MQDNHKLALYVTYYLSRFDRLGLKNLGYKTWEQAYENIAQSLTVNPHSVQNWKDEFDPLFGHRSGWHQRPMIQSRVRVVQALESLREPEIRGIVQDILSGEIEQSDTEQLISIATEDRKIGSGKKFILRIPTGKVAEEFFLQHHKNTSAPMEGEIVDCRDLGIGYDFKIVSKDRTCFVEVKGLSDFSGGVLFTGKEWEEAVKIGNDYFLCIVSNLNKSANILFIQNPAEKLKPKKNISTVIQITWNVTEKQIAQFNG